MTAAPPSSPFPMEILTGDALLILPTLAPDSFDALITDPPYSSGGLYRTDRAMPPSDKYQQYERRHKYLDFPGDGRDQRSFLAWTTLWLCQAYPLLRINSRVYLFTDWRQLPTVTDALQCAGFTWRGIITWDKGPSARAPHKGYHRHQSEFILWGTKGRCPIATHGGPWPGVYHYRTDPREKLHMTGKPLELMRNLCAATPPGAHILDPFAGSGTTLLAAQQTGRPALGIELDPHWCDVSAARLAAA